MNDLAQLLTLPEAGFLAEDDADAVEQYCREHGWTDGLPIVPPTQQRVLRMLRYCARPWDQGVAHLPPHYGAATPLRIAANAVMAGCLPEYFPLVLLALEAMSEERFNLYGVQATTHPAAPLLIFNGPVARELGINAGQNALGPGGRANATIGRAVRFALVNIGGAVPGQGDMCTYGTPAKFSYCAAENEAASPWDPLHVERGFARQASTVTVVAAEAPQNINDHESLNAEGILQTMAGNMCMPGVNDIHHPAAEPVVLICPEHAQALAAGGYSKAAVKQYFFAHARVPLGSFSDENRERRLRQRYPEQYGNATLDTMVPVVKAAENFTIVVIGGAGKHSAFIPTFGSTRSVTRALRHADGSDVLSIDELRQN